MKILVVDDSEVQRKAMMKVLLKLGHDVDEAEDGDIAIDMTNKANYDLMLLDMHMPVCDGLCVIDNIDSAVRIIIVSAVSNDNSMVIEALLKGAIHFIRKPYILDDIVEVLNKLGDDDG